MSIPVTLADLADAVSQFGPSALLVTTASGGPPHVSSVVVTFEADALAMRVGNTTRANATLHPAIALVWPGGVDDDYCLIVDAVAQPEPTEAFVVRPTAAVLHRRASAPTDLPRCVAVGDAAPMAAEPLREQ